MNYRNHILIDIIDRISPYGLEQWKLVAIAYLDAVEAETELRDPKDLRDHWNKKLCNSFKKPTGAANEPGDRILRCIGIEREIQQANDAGVMGASSAEDTDGGDDDDSVLGQVQDGDVDFYENAYDDYEDYEENGDYDVDVPRPHAGMADTAATTNPAANPVAVANPTAAGTYDTTAPAVANPTANLIQPSIASAFIVLGAVSPIPLTHPTTTTTATNRPVRSRSRSSTPNPGVNSNSGGKTKNSTNRNRTSVAKTIDKLTTSINNSLNGGEGENMSAMLMMAMSMMQQQQMNQQQQFQQQQQLNALLRQGESTLKYMKQITKGSKKRKAKKHSSKKNKKNKKNNDSDGIDMDMDVSSSSSSSSSSDSDSSDE